MTNCPNIVYWVPVSTTTRPVTHVEVVAVNKASIQATGDPVEEIGSVNRNAPIRMINPNPDTRIRGGVSWNSFCGCLIEILHPANNFFIDLQQFATKKTLDPQCRIEKNHAAGLRG
ncbi:MAG: hypothetical protein K0R75_2069 [Paenibacillaceae bacterium]|nr:hypothetical protein [Paenibacillaceae bacterium]